MQFTPILISRAVYDIVLKNEGRSTKTAAQRTAKNRFAIGFT